MEILGGGVEELRRKLKVNTAETRSIVSSLFLFSFFSGKRQHIGPCLSFVEQLDEVGTRTGSGRGPQLN